MEEIQRIVEVVGISALGRTGAKEIGAFLESKDNDVGGRNACLELAYVMYLALGK